jgi:ribosomal protein S18 acetylase RimI-like enzyme
MEERMIIRNYQSKDRDSVNYIQLQTYLIGKPLHITNKKGINDSISYYLNKEPQSCFVADDNGKVVGYLLGCLDDKNHEESIFSFLWFVYRKIPLLPFMEKHDRRFWKGQIMEMTKALIGKSGLTHIKHPENPGHIHINLLPEARGKGIGTKLVKKFFKYAKSKKVKVIHADSWSTRLNNNRNFWLKNGFKEYSRVSTSFWNAYYPKEKIDLVCYYRIL